MPPTPLVSIALATCNAGRHLDAQLASLLAQDWPNLEFVVSDDGSTDGTRDRLQALADADSRVRLLPAGPRLGVNANFLRCFAACTGDFVSPCDQDDLWAPDKTARLVAACPAGGIAYCDSAFIDDDGHPFPPPRARMSDTRRMAADPPLLGLLRANGVSGHAMLFARSLLDDLPAIPDTVLYDWWLVLVARARGLSVAWVDAPLVQYRRHGAAVTASGTGRSAQARKLDALRRSHALARAVEAFADGRARDEARDYREAYETWLAGFLPLRAFAWHWRNRHAVFWTDRAPVRAALRQLVGHRLKRALRPSRHPAVALVDGAVVAVD